MTTRYAFVAEWVDTIASLVRTYTVCFFPETNSVEMIDRKNQRIFLRKTVVPNDISEFFIGNSVNVCGRLLKITGFADKFTESELGNQLERTLVMVKPDAVSKLGEIIEAIGDTDGLNLTAARMARLSLADAKEFYAEHAQRDFYFPLCEFMSSGPVVALEVVGQGAIGKARGLIGPTDSAQARDEARGSLRARFGTDGRRNAVHGSDSTGAAARELKFFFDAKRGDTCCTLSNESALCLIKPHTFIKANTSGVIGRILQDIGATGCAITGFKSQTLDKAAAMDFLEVYKGVVPEYMDMVAELTRGPLIAVEVTSADARANFRGACGPSDPEIARHLRPDTLRAKYGVNKVQNALHCTDLPEDIPLELEYFFQLL